MREAKRALLLVLCQILVLALVPRVPLVLSTDTYFYHEDDAHHFNRTVEMAKRGDPNPYYFNKPSLHFYLRLPVIAASVAFEKLRGRMRSVQEIRTRDPYGLAGYAYTTSHPAVLRWNRALSAAASLAIVLIASLMAWKMGASKMGIFLTGLLTAFSPEFLANSHIIGVDIMMALFCVLSTLFAMSAARSFTFPKLILSGLCAGLAGASKYNALPIAFVPLAVWVLKDRSLKGLALCGVLPLVGFLLGCPYAAITPKEFWSGLSYEVWHYGVAGHEGHTAQPGIAQALFYLSWLTTDGVGLLGTILAALGVSFLLSSRSPQAIVFLIFPFLYTTLMVFQKANFTRNMVVIVPYVAIAAGYAFAAICSILVRKDAPRSRSRNLLASFIISGFFAGTIAPEVQRSSTLVSEAVRVDSRESLASWIRDVRPIQNDVAIAGALQVRPELFSLPGVDAFDPTKQSFANLIQSGYDYIAIPSDLIPNPMPSFLTQNISLSGEVGQQRVPHSPAITVLKVVPEALTTVAATSPSELEIIFNRDSHVLPCEDSREGHCWSNSRITKLKIFRTSLHAPTTIKLMVMSPWQNQLVKISSSSGTQLATLELSEPGAWKHLDVTIPPNALTATLSISQVHSPESRHVGEDRRRLGVALKIAP